MLHSVSRRSFMVGGAAASLGLATALASGRAAGANERVRLGFIGIANRGSQLIEATLPHADADIVALCDIDENAIDLWKGNPKLPLQPRIYKDHRELLAQGDIDAVVIATPDHWHAIQTMEACDAGKDVYIEKPLAMTVYEGRRMVEKARQTNRVVQVGLHRRSSKLLLELRDLVRSGKLGKITMGRSYRLSNMYPNGIGKMTPGDPPPTLDWDRWLGPRAFRQFQGNIAPYKFRWWLPYSSQLGNWGVHYFDLIRWMLDEEAPASVSSHGGRFAIDDDRTIPDTLETIFEFASGRLMLFGQLEASGAPMLDHGAEFELRGTQGIVHGHASRCKIIGEKGGQFQDTALRMEEMELTTDEGDLTEAHIRNFLDCIKSRATPNCDVEEGHKSTIFAHLGNMALASETRIKWDAKGERVISPESVNEMLHYEYRAPWKLPE